MTKIIFIDLGFNKYYETWLYQKKLFNDIRNHKRDKKILKKKVNINNYLIFTEHPHVYTMGKSGKDEHILYDKNFLKKKI